MNTPFKFVNLVKNCILYIFLSICTLVFFYPFYFSVISSFKKDTQIFAHPFALPADFSLENYFQAWKVGKVGVSFINTLFISSASTVITIFISAMAAFILAKYLFKGVSVIYVYFISGLMIPIQSVVIPLSIMVSVLKIDGGFVLAILLFTAFNLPFAVFVLTGFIKILPSSLQESAIIDGASNLTVFLRIIFPLSKPAIATVSIFVFMYVWKDLLIPLLFLQKAEQQTLSIGIMQFMGQYQSFYGYIMAAIVVMVMPLILLFLFTQEKVIQGMTAGAIKG